MTKSKCNTELCELVDNSGRTNNPFFESQIIRELAPSFEDDVYTGVLSWQVQAKIGGGVPYLHAKALISKSDIIGRGNVGNHWVIAENYHPNFKELSLQALEIARLPRSWYYGKGYMIHFNYQILKGKHYKKFVNECLGPVMDALDNELKDLAYTDAGYKGLNTSNKEALLKLTGVPHYPHHPFICERLFGSWAYHNRLSITQV